MDCLEQKIVSMYQMMYFLRNSCFGLIALLFVVACSRNPVEETLPYYNSPDFTPIFISAEEDPGSKITHQIGDFSFTNQHGETIDQKAIENKIHVANFIFTTCGSICPVMTHNMAKVSDKFKDDDEVVILSFSVTPWIDTVEKLKQYAADKAIDDDNWHLLTGDKAKIYQLARKSYFAEESIGFTRDSTEFLHTEHFVLVDKHKRLRGIYNGTLKLEISLLMKDIKRLKTQK